MLFMDSKSVKGELVCFGCLGLFSNLPPPSLPLGYTHTNIMHREREMHTHTHTHLSLIHI